MTRIVVVGRNSFLARRFAALSEFAEDCRLVSHREALKPLVFDETECYGDKAVTLKNTRSYEWTHGVGEVVSALLKAGLGLEALTEHEFLAWDQFPFMVADDEGLWWLPEGSHRLPLSFSLQATKSL